MEQRFNKSGCSIDLQLLREFCQREGKMIDYRKGEQFEREGDPARWFAYVESGCFKYVTLGRSDGRDHLTWFSFEGEFVADCPSFLSGQPSQATIEAMMPSRVLRVSSAELIQFFHQSIKNMELRALASEHILSQYKSRYLDFHCATPSERYDQLLHRCPGIVQHLPLGAIASFLGITPQMLSRIRKAASFSSKL